MGKGLRSKAKRAARTEFRNTIGKKFSERSMDTVQAKLQECISKGNMNSFERLTRTFQSDTVTDGATNNSKMDIDNQADSSPNHNSSTTSHPDNKQLVLLNKKKHRMPFAPGQSGARLARKIISKRNRRGQISIGVGIIKKHKAKAIR